MNIKIQLLRPEALVPHYHSDGAAAFDLRSLDTVDVPPGTTYIFPTGLAVAFGREWGLFIHARGGLGAKGLRMANCVAVIDSDYRGEIMVPLHNDTRSDMRVNAGDRIAQGVVSRVEHAKFELVTELPPTVRGHGRFGSTGVA